MTTTTSSPDRFGSFLRDLLRKNRANMIYLLVLGFISLPLQYLVAMLRGWRDIDGVFHYNTISGFGETGIYVGGSIVMMTMIWLITTLVIGIASTSYMQNRRAVDLYHSLPLTRHQIMLGNFTAAFITVVLPLTINYLVTYLLAAIRMGMAPEATAFSLGLCLMDLLGWYVTVFAMLAVILLMATQVGSTFDTFLFSGVFLAALPILYAMHFMLCEGFLYGFVDRMSAPLLCCLSPATMAAGKYLCGVQEWNNIFGGGLAVWLVLGALLLLFAMHEYKKRPSERAESTARVGIAAFIFRLVAVLVGGTVLGIGFYALVFGDIGEDGINLPLLLLCIAVFGALVFLLVEAILGRGFKGLEKKHLLTGAVLIAVTVIYVAMLATGGLGFESRIPAAEDVSSVTIDYRGRYDYVSHYRANTATPHTDYKNDGSPVAYYSYDNDTDVTLESPEAIQCITKLHGDILAQRYETTGAEATENGAYRYPVSKNIRVRYEMKDGSTVLREYDMTVEKDVLADLTTLEDTDEFRRMTSPLEDWSSETNEVEIISVTGPAGHLTVDITELERIETLMTALRTDARMESTESYYDPARETVAYLYIESSWTQKWESTPAENDFWSSFTVPISTSYENTLALLREWGILDSVAESDWNMSRVFCWGCTDNYSGLIVFPTWDGMEKNASEGYASAAISREKTELLLQKARYTHPNNGGDDSLYICLGWRDESGESINMPVYITIRDARDADIPEINDLINEYYGWSKDEADGEFIETVETVDSIEVA